MKPKPRPAEALFAATGPGTVSLLLGSPAGALAEAIRTLGGRVVLAPAGPGTPGDLDTTGDREPVRLRMEADARLPFDAASFDSVIAPYLSREGLERGAGGAPALDLARECARVLKPGGRLLLSVPNPRIQKALRLALAASRIGPIQLLPRRVAARLRLHQAAPGAFPYGRRPLAGLLRAAGFEAMAGFEMWPRLGSWRRLVPEKKPGDTRRGRLAAARHKGLPARLAALTGAVPARFVVAQMAGGTREEEGGARRPVLEGILDPDASRGPVISAPTLMSKGNGIALTAIGDDFFKISLTETAAARQRIELTANQRLRSTPAREFMVDLRRAGEIGRLNFAVYQRVEAFPTPHDAAGLAAQVEAFRLLAAGAEPRPLGRTESWARIVAAGSRTALEALGAAPLLDHMEGATGWAVPAGVVHGDLHLRHIMRLAGRTVLIDWDRSEFPAPLVLDRCNGVLRLLARRLRPADPAGWHLDALARMARRDADVPLLECIDEVAGELAWTHVMALHVLSSSSWRLMHYGASSPEAQREVRDALTFCRSLID